MRQNRGWAMRIARTEGESAFAKRVIRACRWRQVGIGIAARPRLDASVQVQRTSFLTEFDQSDARYVDRDVEEKVAVSELWLEYGVVVVAGQWGLNEANTIFGCDIVSARLGRYNG